MKGDRRRLLRNYVSVRSRREHVPSNLTTKVNDSSVDVELGGPDQLKICRRVRVCFDPSP